MIKWRLVPFTLLLSLLCIYSCDDDEKIINGGSNGDPPPDGVGLLWIYEVYDSLTLTTDTVWVSVTDTVSHSDGATSLRLRLNWTVADVVVDRYAKIQGDTIDITSDTTVGSMFLERFILPLTVGSEWIVSGGTDTSRVTDVGTVTVEAGRFDSAALIERVWNRDFEGGGSWSQTWFAPDVGAVRRYLFSAWSDGSSIRISVNQTWELLRYDLSTFYLSRFPNSVGTQWVYQVIDTSLDLVDTVTVTIKSEVPVSWADSGWLWQRRGRLATDTVYMGVSDDILFVSHSDDILYFDSWYYEFPLTVGRHWGMEYFGAIPVIVDKGAVTSLAGEFPSAFHYRMSGGAFNDYWTVDDWLVPGVGMVRREYTTFGLGPAFEQQWNLISYRVQ